MIKIKNYRQTIILEDTDNKSGYLLYCNGLDNNIYFQYEAEITDIIEENHGFSDKLKEYFFKQIDAKKFSLVREFVRYDNNLSLTQAVINTKDGNTYTTQIYILNEIKEILKGYYESHYIIFNENNGALIYIPSSNLSRISINQNF